MEKGLALRCGNCAGEIEYTTLADGIFIHKCTKGCTAGIVVTETGLGEALKAIWTRVGVIGGKSS